MRKISFTIAIAILCLAGTGCAPKTTGTTGSEMSNPVIETIMARRSVRHYTDQAVPREILQQIAECGVNAPNAMNRQQWEVRIIDSQEYFDGLTQVMKESSPFPMGDDDPKFRNALRNATAAIAVACPDDESGMCLINVGLLCENVCLAAKSLGLGSVVMAGPVMMMNNTPAAKPFLDRLNFSEGYKLRVIVGLGYPDEEPEAKPRDLGKIQFAE
ncbi:MAG: nitroreductase family protein [Bacteroidales bacterium]|nr:nitroreductase family protein [Bacteroidales bacterium]